MVTTLEDHHVGGGGGQVGTRGSDVRGHYRSTTVNTDNAQAGSLTELLPNGKEMYLQKMGLPPSSPFFSKQRQICTN